MDQGLHGIDACYRLYETQDGWIQIAAVKESEWIALCSVLGVPDLADDARFAVAELPSGEPRGAGSAVVRTVHEEDRDLVVAVP